MKSVQSVLEDKRQLCAASELFMWAGFRMRRAHACNFFFMEA